jgi:hypothetical protein
VSATLQARLEQQLRLHGLTTPETGWHNRLRAVPGPIGETTTALIDYVGERAEVLGEQIAAEQPDWAVLHLGAVPAEETERAAWVQRAGRVAAYREWAGVDAAAALGPAPSEHSPLMRAAWADAFTALGAPEQARDIYGATDDQLREMRAAWQREQTWQPAHVAGDLEKAHTLRAEFERDAIELRARRERGHLTRDEHLRLVEQLERAERQHARWAARAQDLETLHATREQWAAHTQDVREAGEAAAAELRRRERPLDLPLVEEPQAEQPAMVDEAGEICVDIDREAAEGELSEADRAAEAVREQAQREQRREAERRHQAEYTAWLELAQARDQARRVEAERAEEPDVRSSSWWSRLVDRLPIGRGTEVEPEPVAEVEPAAAPVERQTWGTAWATTDAEAVAPAVEQVEVDPDQLMLFEVEQDATAAIRAAALTSETTVKEALQVARHTEHLVAVRQAEREREQADAAEEAERLRRDAGVEDEQHRLQARHDAAVEADMLRDLNHGRELELW